jgi:magnesium-transporting ATPase (P-type)
MLFAGTAVASGSGVGIVTSIGMSTEIGKIQSQIQEASQEEEDTPLKQKLDQFGELLAKVRCYFCHLLNLCTCASCSSTHGSCMTATSCVQSKAHE